MSVFNPLLLQVPLIPGSSGGPIGLTYWGKYVVWGGAQPGPLVPYTTIGAAIAAALADGAGPAKPVAVFVMPGSYTESLALQPGIHLFALSGGGGQNEQPEVIVTGNHTVADVAGSLTIDGIDLRSTNATATLTVAGAAQIQVRIARSWIDASAGTQRAVDFSNSSAVSVLAFEDSRVLANIAANDVVRTGSASFNAAMTSFVSGSTINLCLSLSAASSDTLDRCDVLGAILHSAGTLTIRKSRINTANATAITSTGTLVLTDVETPLGMGLQTNAAVSPQRVCRQTVPLKLTGAGPHTVTSANDLYNVAPGAGVTSIVNLPDAQTLVEGDEYAFYVSGSGLTSAVVIIDASGAQTFSDGALNQRLYEGGSIILKVDRAAEWRIVAINRGVPDTLALFIHPSTGSNTTGFGTSAAPYQTMAFAFQVANRDRYRTNGSVTVQAAGTENLNTQMLDVPGGVGPISQPFVINGLYQGAAGFAASYTTTAAGTAYAAGPPIVLTAATTGAAAEWNANGARSRFIRFTSGALSGQRFPVVASATAVNGTINFVGPAGTAPGIASGFVIEEPAFVLSGTLIGFKAGTGNRIQINAMNLGVAVNAVRFLGVEASLNGCRTGLVTANESIVGLGLTSTLTELDPFAAAFASVAAGAIGSCVNGLRGDCSSVVSMQNSLTTDAVSIPTHITVYANKTTFAEGALEYRGDCCELTECTFLNFVVSATQGKGIVFNNITVVNTTAARAALVCSNGSSAFITNLRGTVAAATVPVQCLKSSRITVTDPNTGTTINGGAGINCQIGVLAVAATTWVLILGNLYANINDNSGAPAGGTGATVSV